jgi:hypothetical protein
MIDYNGEKVLCLCEGTFEKELIELLLENDLLFFTTEDLVEEKVITERNVKNIKTFYLNRKYDDGLIILRVLDSETERFNLGNEYSKKVDNIITANTKPEIEILVIIDSNHYDVFTRRFKSHTKPSSYCRGQLNIKNVKQQGFVRNYFSDIDSLVQSLETYKRYTNQKNYTIFDLLK